MRLVVYAFQFYSRLSYWISQVEVIVEMVPFNSIVDYHKNHSLYILKVLCTFNSIVDYQIKKKDKMDSEKHPFNSIVDYLVSVSNLYTSMKA
ncbi:hypothetical protein J5U21_01774 [Saccharolobus shibatae]|uniref:Uncharacterized protein n=1 Tax=Saccharolobus shibatae TaxID=2286 RepID=A0A8F5BVK0_9CREN|nr:hypothetical protein J5U21_01774 [Saccharolobus shibatae]